ncbi:helix-turn-helix domain-containing protein [Streptomyces sp. NPDC055105]|uniref:helix-turn-helix domain-containing protein n=1 Tax=Streptomyces sp. NPDC055105 TaxID=3365719 RepID=UPI0037D35AD0
MEDEAHGGPGWRRILERLAAERHALVEDFLGRLTSSGLYASETVPADDLRQSAADTMDLLILRLAGRALPPELRDLPHRLGVRRARQGVRRESLLEAVRLDFRVLWAGLVRAAAGGPLDPVVGHTEDLLSVVERYISDVQAAFLDEEATLARDSRVLAMRAFSRLLNARDRVEEVAEEAAGPLGLEADGIFEVALVRSPRDTLEGQPAFVDVASRSISWEFEDGCALVRAQLRGRTWVSCLAGAEGGYVGDVRGLAAVPAAIESARVVARVTGAEAGCLVTEAEVWPAIAAEQMVRALPDFGRAEVRSLDGLGAQDRRRLLETLRAFVDSGSIKNTAERLYCHRNTVVNRLRLFQDLTGLDMAVPVDAARALVVFGPELTRLGTRSPAPVT